MLYHVLKFPWEDLTVRLQAITGKAIHDHYGRVEKDPGRKVKEIEARDSGQLQRLEKSTSSLVPIAG